MRPSTVIIAAAFGCIGVHDALAGAISSGGGIGGTLIEDLVDCAVTGGPGISPNWRVVLAKEQFRTDWFRGLLVFYWGGDRRAYVTPRTEFGPDWVDEPIMPRGQSQTGTFSFSFATETGVVELVRDPDDAGPRLDGTLRLDGCTAPAP
jgi:hypothetical protein